MNRIFKKTIDIYIINLDHRQDRLKNILIHLGKIKRTFLMDIKLI